MITQLQKKVITDLIRNDRKDCNVEIVSATGPCCVNNISNKYSSENKFIASLFSEEEMRGEIHTPTIYITHSQTINNTPYLNAIIKIVSNNFGKNYKIITSMDDNLTNCLDKVDIIVGIPLFDDKLPYNVASEMLLGLQEKKAIYKVSINDFSFVRCMDEDKQILSSSLSLSQHKYTIEHNVM